MSKIVSVILAFIQSVMVFLGVLGGNSGVWKLDGVPCYEKGIVCDTLYNTGSGLAVDSSGTTKNDGKMQGFFRHVSRRPTESGMAKVWEER